MVQERGTGRAILLTPPGGAAIAVVRLAGTGVGAFLRKYFSKPPREGRCVHGTLADGERVIDDPVVVLHPGGAVADVNAHGGPWVVRSLLELARREGFDVAERVEAPLPDEAVDADGELAREVLRYLPLARTELALQALLAQERAWESLVGATPASPASGAATKGEAGRAPARGPGRGDACVARVFDTTTGEAGLAPTLDVPTVLDDRSLYWLLHPPRVAIVGAPNVGKSTLANQLFAQERSITADLPGTTRDWVGEIANIDGLAVMLVDTPGVRETVDPIEREAIERSRGQVSQADLVVLVLDQSQPPEERYAGLPGVIGKEQSALMGQYWFKDPGVLYVVNKADRPKRWGCFVDCMWLRTVATKGEGVDRLRREIKRRFLGPEPFAVERPRWWTQRQREILERAMNDPGALLGI